MNSFGFYIGWFFEYGDNDWVCIGGVWIMLFSVCMRDCYDICLILSEFKDGKLLVRGNFEYLIMVGFFCFKGVFLLKWFYLFDRLKVFLMYRGEGEWGV